VQDLLRYDQMVETALRSVVREALARTAEHGLPGTHHFYITFLTKAPGVKIADALLEHYPDEMTIVLEHQFWDLEVNAQDFGVTLSFNNKPERLVVPFAAISAFADPAVKFGLQFQPAEDAESAGTIAAAESAAPEKPEAKPDKPGEVVALDSFRKK
jgi:uncharacterized protein